MNKEIFREYDIRGIVGKEIDENFAYLLGRGFAKYLTLKGAKTPLSVSIGHDARLSCPSLVAGLTKGLNSSGVSVLHLGLVTTPMSYFSTFTLPVSGGIMVTGSHNPPEYNGFKISLGNSTIFGQEILKLYDIMRSEQFIEGTGKSEKVDVFAPYLEKYGNDIKLKNPVKVIVDCGNGAAGVIVKKLFSKMGINFEILFEEPDGKFPNHHPDPTVERNMVALSNKVKESGANVGIGFDGDADRLGVVDHNGRLLYGDELMIIFSRAILKSHPGSTIIGDVKCSDRLYADIKKNGGKPIMYKTGHSLIKNKMKEIGSPFSGEMSGHVFFADRNYGYDDAVYAGARLVEIMSQEGKTVPQLLEGLPPAFATPEIRIDTTEEKKAAVVNEMRKVFGNGKYKVDETDGIRISFDDGFALVRSSNTQPVVVCRFEASSKARMQEIQNLVEGHVRRLL